MANFLRPTYEIGTGFTEKKPNGLAYVYVPLGQTRDIALWGGDSLWVQFNDFDSPGCPAHMAEKKTAGNTYRFFTITPRRLGHTLLEARQGGRHGPIWDFVQIIVEPPIAWGAKVSHGFKTKVLSICSRLKIEPDYLMAAMAFETGRTFSPTVRNHLSGAIGLIQFMPAAAALVGTNMAALPGMTAIQQLDYVERYMAHHIRAAAVASLQSLEDVYMAIIWPAGIGKPDTHVLFRQGSNYYTQNAGLDADHDGTVTKFEAAAAVRAQLLEGRRHGRLG